MLNKKSKYNLKIKLYIILIPILVYLCLSFADRQMRPYVYAVAKIKTQSAVTQAVNDGIMQGMENQNIKYQDLINIKKDENNIVTDITYNEIAVTNLKLNLMECVIDKTEHISPIDIYISIGNITNIDFIQNKGFQIKFTITPMCYVEADVVSEFIDTGINQVNHKIYLIFTTHSNALIPNYSTDIIIVNKVCVAQTIIVGKVPNNIGNSLALATN